MNKKIFITGAVRDYDSSKPEEFADAIAQFIKDNMVDEKSKENISVAVREVSPNQIVISFLFTTGDEIVPGTISHTLYRCFFGECRSFIAEHSLGSVMNFGPNWKANWRETIPAVRNAHKRNTAFYGADKYKRIDIVENNRGLEVRISF